MGQATEIDQIVSMNPAEPEQVVASVPVMGAAALDRRIEAASGAWPEWAADAAARANALQRWAERVAGDATALAALVSDEVGKPIGEARAEVARTVAILRYYAQAAFDRIAELLPGSTPYSRTMVERRPLGVVAAICPWNFPLAIPAWKLGPALAYGNAVLFKPSSDAVGSGERLTELARPDLPEQLLTLVPARGADADALFDDDRVSGVSFTGSSAVGRRVVARVAARGGAVQAEMGGQNASIVLEDADLDHAAITIAAAAMGYAGQKCTATRRVIVSRPVAETFIERLSARVNSLQVGDPRAEATDVGPVIHESAQREVRSAIAQALDRGAELVAGGETVDRQGWFVRPTLIRVDDPTDAFVQEETFGPAAAIMVVDSTDEALRIANGTRFGLAAAVFSTDVNRAEHLAARLTAGMVRVNGSTTGADFWVPFGGDGASSYGPREQGRAAREFYTRTRTITMG
ncbi:MAG: aldehyde dehydrogenase family protein [Chloroflexota bacterium]